MSAALNLPSLTADDPAELAFAVIEPHFDAVRDHFAEHEVEPGKRLSRVLETRLLVSEHIRDRQRRYAATRTDGLLMVIAPEAAALPIEQLVAIIAHEFGHAADFLYPGRFLGRRNEPAVWVPKGAKKEAQLQRLWLQRSDDQIEWDADSIAMLVTGQAITYCGDDLLQCFGGGVARPAGLR